MAETWASVGPCVVHVFSPDLSHNKAVILCGMWAEGETELSRIKFAMWESVVCVLAVAGPVLAVQQVYYLRQYHINIIAT